MKFLFLILTTPGVLSILSKFLVLMSLLLTSLVVVVVEVVVVVVAVAVAIIVTIAVVVVVHFECAYYFLKIPFYVLHDYIT